MKSLNKYTNVLIILIFSLSACKKNSPSDIQKEEFYKSFGGAYQDVAVDFIFNDNFFYILGNEQNEDGIYNIILIKTDEFGNKLWEKNYDNNNESATQGNKIIKLKNNNEFAIIGTIEIDSDSLYNDIFLLKLNTEGEIKLAKTISLIEDQTGKSIAELDNGGFTIAAKYTNITNGESRRIFFPVDGNGNHELDLFAISEQGKDVFSICKYGNDEGYYITGINKNNEPDITLLTNDGEHIGPIKFEFNGEFTNILKDINGNIFVCGKNNNGENGKQDAFIAQINVPQYEIVWSLDFGDSGDDWATKVIESGNGNLMITGSLQNVKLNTYDIFVLEVNKNGELINSKIMGGDDNEYGTGIYSINNSSFVIESTNHFESSSFISIIKSKF